MLLGFWFWKAANKLKRNGYQSYEKLTAFFPEAALNSILSLDTKLILVYTSIPAIYYLGKKITECAMFSYLGQKIILFL